MIKFLFHTCFIPCILPLRADYRLTMYVIFDDLFLRVLYIYIRIKFVYRIHRMENGINNIITANKKRNYGGSSSIIYL